MVVGRERRYLGSDLTLFDFDRDNSILRRLTGKVKEAHAHLFKHATGSSNLRVSSKLQSKELEQLGRELLTLYRSNAFKQTFPDIQNISPVRDPDTIQSLDEKLLTELQQGDEPPELIVPDLIDYDREVFYSFSGSGSSLMYDELFIDEFFDYLTRHGRARRQITLEDLKKHKVLMTDANGVVRSRNSIYKSLVFDTKLGRGAALYHLSEGNWYKIDADFASKLRDELDNYFEVTTLMPYRHKNEGTYNAAVAAADANTLCLDKTNIAPPRQAQLEPCDLYKLEDEFVEFGHVKRSTLSDKLSHLFNQGVNSIEVVLSDENSLDKLKALIAKKAPAAKVADFTEPLDNESLKVLFAIVTHKDPANKSDNLPLFSRISLRRILRALKLWKVPGAFAFVKDESPRKPGKPKKRKKRAR